MSNALGFIMLFGGCVYLLIGGDFLVRGALAMSRRTSVSPMLIGLTVVAFGTSLPELIVSLQAALVGHADIAIGNVVGSNIANVLLVLGVPALVYPLMPADPTLGRQVQLMLVVTVVFVGLCFVGPFGRLDGLGLLAVMLLGLVLTIRGQATMPGIDRAEAEEQLERVIDLPQRSVSIALLIVLGCAFLPIGAGLAVDGAVSVASSLGVPEAAIASTMVALGTSLPELSSTLIAAFRRSADMAFGSVIGSNVLNILIVMGVTAAIIEVPVPPSYLLLDVWVMLGAGLLLAGYVLTRRPIGRVAGLAFLAAYVGYCGLVL